MSGGFQVRPEQLSSHSATVGGIARSVSEAADAAAIERGGGLIYGVLFDALVWVALNPWADHIQELIATSASTGEAIAAGLKNNAELYDGVETANSGHIKKSGHR